MIAGENPRLIDLPGGPLMVDYERLPGTNCIINDRRIYLNQAGPTEPSEGNLAQMATVAASALQGATMVAYGKNFHVRGSVEAVGNMGRFLRDRFLRNLNQLEVAFGGPVLWLLPNFKYVVGNIEHRLAIDCDETDQSLFRARLNIHHDTESLPSLDDLSAELREGFQYLRELLSKLLKQE
jgi:hypothetical protein